MHSQVVRKNIRVKEQDTLPEHTLRDRADDVLVAIAVLGLVATVADGEADYREIESFTKEFRKQFALSKRHSLRLIGAALQRITRNGQADIIDCACDTLRENLDSSQRVRLFEGLAAILLADGKIHEGEEYFLDYVVQKLDLQDTLERQYRD
ncbi:MAG: TerB family tellurite resistance protein [Deltaproteobacteria bacterium]|nr:TerB family tellurite resistance protein [Deltaproteobacteria bacterium]